MKIMKRHAGKHDAYMTHKSSAKAADHAFTQ